MNDKPSMKPVDLCWILMEAAPDGPGDREAAGHPADRGSQPRSGRCYVKADAQEAEQLLFHLLSNALRAVSPGGQIKIRLTRDDEDLYLIVEDDGCACPPVKTGWRTAAASWAVCRQGCCSAAVTAPTWVGAFPHAARCRKRHPGRVRIPLAGTMFPIEGSVELHTIHPALTTADGLRWQILRELALLSDKME